MISTRGNRDGARFTGLSGLVCAVSLLVLAGCASTTKTPVAQKDLAKIGNALVALVDVERPSFGIYTPSIALMGAIGAGAQYSGGEKAVREHGLTDPAVSIRATVADVLATRFGASITTRPSLKTHESSASELAAAASSDTTLVVDVRTTAWTMVYLAPSLTTYGLDYRARITLIDAKTGDRIGVGNCWFKPTRTGNDPRYDDMLANNAGLLKEKLAAATKQCADEFVNEVLPPAS